ncbi:MAG: flagellar export protein FliJ [Candidatus Kapaibacteriota bacterium]
MAKKFSFRLEPVLKIREQNKKIAQAELMIAINERIETELYIQKQKDYIAKLNTIQKENLKIDELRNLYYHKLYLKAEIQKFEDRKEILTEKEKVKQRHYNSALQEEKIMLKLKEKQKIIHKEIAEKEEQKNLDEIGLRISNKLSD